MFEIRYSVVFVGITILWILSRIYTNIKNKDFSLKHEFKLLSVYICLVVIIRIVYFPVSISKNPSGVLIFDPDRLIPPFINLVPFVHMFDIYNFRVLNIIGNITMFIPVGICWPYCFKWLNSIPKVVLDGGFFSLCIELTQLLFYDRCTDIDDLIMNTTGVLIGAIIYFSCKKIRDNLKKKKLDGTVEKEESSTDVSIVEGE